MGSKPTLLKLNYNIKILNYLWNHLPTSPLATKMCMCLLFFIYIRYILGFSLTPEACGGRVETHWVRGIGCKTQNFCICLYLSHPHRQNFALIFLAICTHKQPKHSYTAYKVTAPSYKETYLHDLTTYTTTFICTNHGFSGKNDCPWRNAKMRNEKYY